MSTPENNELTTKAIAYIKDLYSLNQSDIFIDEQIHNDINWRPSFYIKLNYFIVAFEVSEKTYPVIFNMSHANILSVHLPITVYNVCSDENFNTSELRTLIKHGFGLITINNDDHVEKIQDGIPLIQHIPEQEFADECKSLPVKIKRRLRESFDSYKAKPQSGLSEITALTEEIIDGVVNQMIKKTWLVANTKNQTLNVKLTRMLASPQCGGAQASIAGLISYVSKYRNMSHHAPRSRKQLYEKIHNSQHGFREGIKQLTHFKEQMKHININLKV